MIKPRIFFAASLCGSLGFSKARTTTRSYLTESIKHLCKFGQSKHSRFVETFGEVLCFQLLFELICRNLVEQVAKNNFRIDEHAWI